MSVRANFDDLAHTTQAIRRTAERILRESSERWTRHSTAELSGLSERLVSDLLPHLAAEESVLIPHLDAGLGAALRASHRKLRELAERIAMVTDASLRSHRPASTARTAQAVLRGLATEMEQLEVLQRAAVSQLEASPADRSLVEIDAALGVAAREARARIVLVTQPEMAATESSVLRRRPDLTRAYAINLSDTEPTSPRRRLD